jgi:hypothetical protein
MMAPQLPPPGTALDKDVAARLASDLDAWVAAVGSQLVDLDGEAQTVGTDAIRMDVAEAFVLWRAVSERAEVWDGAADGGGRRRAEALAASWTPVVTATGETVGSGLADAIAFLDALIARLATEVAAAGQEAATAASSWMALDADLLAARRAATVLGEEVRHVAELEADAKSRPRALAPPAELARKAAASRARLEAAIVEREELLDRLDAAPALVAELDRQESAVRELAATCREKIRDAPVLAVPSVSSLGAAPGGFRDRPWPAVQAAARAWLRQVERTQAALIEASRRFQAPLTRRDELRGLLQAFRDKADSAGLAEHEALDVRYATARDTLWSAPCDLARAEAEVQDYIATLNSMMHGVN